jgi:hypothetical protein
MNTIDNIKSKMISRHHYVIKEEFFRLLRFYNDNKKQLEVMDQESQEVVVTAGRSVIETGAEYLLRVDGAFANKVKVLKNERKRSYFKRKLSVQAIYPFTFIHGASIYLMEETCFNQTVYCLALNADTSDNLTIINNIYNEETRNIIGEKIVNKLKKYIEDLYQVESVVINIEMKKVWEIISDWKKLQQIDSSVPEIIETFGNLDKVGDTFTVKLADEKLYLRVVKIELNDRDASYELHCCIDDEMKIVCMIINFFLVKLNDKSCYLKMTHKFVLHTASDTISLLRDGKIETLKRLKKLVEKK